MIWTESNNPPKWIATKQESFKFDQSLKPRSSSKIKVSFWLAILFFKHSSSIPIWTLPWSMRLLAFEWPHYLEFTFTSTKICQSSIVSDWWWMVVVVIWSQCEWMLPLTLSPFDGPVYVLGREKCARSCVCPTRWCWQHDTLFWNLFSLPILFVCTLAKFVLSSEYPVSKIVGEDTPLVHE